MAFDVDKWLREDLGFTEDEAKELSPRLGGKSDVLEKGYLRQSDYSKQMNALQKTQTDLATANDRLNTEMSEWAKLTAEQQEREPALKASIDAAEAKAFALQQKLIRVAEEHGIDPKTLIAEPVAAPKKEEPVLDLKPIREQIGGLGDYMLTLTAELPAIAQEHYELTGERLDTRAFIAGIKADLKAGKFDNTDPVQRWEKQYQIPQKRTEKSTAAVDARIAAAREEGLTAGRSEAMLPGGKQTVGRSEGSATVFRSIGQSKLARPNPADHLSGARTALAEGRYRNAGPGGVMPASK